MRMIVRKRKEVIGLGESTEERVNRTELQLLEAKVNGIERKFRNRLIVVSVTMIILFSLASLLPFAMMSAGKPDFYIDVVYHQRVMGTVEFDLENIGTGTAHETMVSVNGQQQRIGLLLAGDLKHTVVHLEVGRVDWNNPQFSIIVACAEGVTRSFSFG